MTISDDRTPDAPDVEKRRSGWEQDVRVGGRREVVMKLEEVACILRCDVRKVRELIRDKHLTAIRLGKRMVRVTERGLHEFLHGPESNSRH